MTKKGIVIQPKLKPNLIEELYKLLFEATAIPPGDERANFIETHCQQISVNSLDDFRYHCVSFIFARSFCAEMGN